MANNQTTTRLKDLKNLSANELVVKARGLEAELFQTKMKKVTGQLSDSATLWRMRKELARVKTLQTQSQAPAVTKVAAKAKTTTTKSKAKGK